MAWNSSWLVDKPVLAGFKDERGQATVEYAIVFFGFLALLTALGTLWRLWADGIPIEHALQSASHHLLSAAPGAISDLFLY